MPRTSPRSSWKITSSSDRECSPFTVQGDILELKLFFRWLVPEKETELFQNITIKKPRRHLPVDQLITRNDITQLVDACDKPRDRALIMLLWDSGPDQRAH